MGHGRGRVEGGLAVFGFHGNDHGSLQKRGQNCNVNVMVMRMSFGVKFELTFPPS